MLKATSHILAALTLMHSISDHFFRTDNGPSNMRISGAMVGNRYSNNLSNRTWVHTQGHIVTERKQHEKLIQRFIALSAIIPDLKKMEDSGCDLTRKVIAKALQDLFKKKT